MTETERLTAALFEIHGHLGAAIMQRAPSDDQIISEHIAAADKIALAALRHFHVAGTTVGKDIDECASCGRDIRNEVHSMRQLLPA